MLAGATNAGLGADSSDGRTTAWLYFFFHRLMKRESSVQQAGDG